MGLNEFKQLGIVFKKLVRAVKRGEIPMTREDLAPVCLLRDQYYQAADAMVPKLICLAEAVRRMEASEGQDQIDEWEKAKADVSRASRELED